MARVWPSLLAVLLLELVVGGLRDSSITSVLVNNKACEDGGARYSTSHSTIISPLYPDSHPVPLFCQWTLNNPDQNTLILSFSKFDLDENECSRKPGDCCAHQWLMIRQPRSRRTKRDGGREDTSNKYNRRISHGTINLGSLPFKPPPFTPSDFTPSTSRHQSAIYTYRGSNRAGSFDATGSTGHVCGRDVPQPIVTRARQVVVTFYSDIHADTTRDGFKLQYYTSVDGECGEDAVKCGGSGVCVPREWRCNGQQECPNGEEEIGCQDMFTPLVVAGEACPGLTPAQYCDGFRDCHHGEDERGCYGCSREEWWCGGEAGECYQPEQDCDGIQHCQNAADELACRCLNLTWCEPESDKCYDPHTQRCDGVPHCPRAQDEVHCSSKCGKKVACGHECYSPDQRCDGSHDCTDGSDEAACSPLLCQTQFGTFLCGDGQCIKDIWRCDQTNDCNDGSDEDGCFRSTVVGVWVMGALVCCLLLVLAMGCTVRLYALRVGISQARQSNRSSAPLTLLQRYLLQRELPPSYNTALTHPTHMACDSGVTQQWLEQQATLTPLLPGLLAPSLLHPLATDPREAELTGSRGNRREEKEREERAKVDDFFPLHFHSPQFQSQAPETEDVPLLSHLGLDGEPTDDVPLLMADSTDDDEGAESVVALAMGGGEAGEESETDRRRGVAEERSGERPVEEGDKKEVRGNDETRDRGRSDKIVEEERSNISEGDKAEGLAENVTDQNTPPHPGTSQLTRALDTTQLASHSLVTVVNVCSRDEDISTLPLNSAKDNGHPDRHNTHLEVRHLPHTDTAEVNMTML